MSRCPACGFCGKNDAIDASLSTVSLTLTSSDEASQSADDAESSCASDSNNHTFPVAWDASEQIERLKKQVEDALRHFNEYLGTFNKCNAASCIRQNGCRV